MLLFAPSMLKVELIMVWYQLIMDFSSLLGLHRFIWYSIFSWISWICGILLLNLSLHSFETLIWHHSRLNLMFHEVDSCATFVALMYLLLSGCIPRGALLSLLSVLHSLWSVLPSLWSVLSGSSFSYDLASRSLIIVQGSHSKCLALVCLSLYSTP